MPSCAPYESEIAGPRVGLMLALLAHLVTIGQTPSPPSFGPALPSSRSCGQNAFQQQKCCRAPSSDVLYLGNRDGRLARLVSQPLRENFIKNRCVGRQQSPAQVANPSPFLDAIFHDLYVGGYVFYILPSPPPASPTSRCRGFDSNFFWGGGPAQHPEHANGIFFSFSPRSLVRVPHR